MTIQQIILMTCLYLVALAAVLYFTRPTGRRFVGALAGGAVVGALVFGAIIPLGEAQGWWYVALDPAPSYIALVYLAMSVSCVPIFLVTWRIARRFGGRGLAVLLTAATAELVESLRPGQPGALKMRPDGTVLEGHHRLVVLRERGIDVDILPRGGAPA